MKHRIEVVTRLSDGQDGGYTMYVYNNNEEMLADHPLAEDGPLTDKQRNDILNEEDPYENGYLGQDVIEVEIVDGVVKLAKGLSFHAGQ